MFGKGYAVVISDVGNDGDREPHGVFAGKFAGHAQFDDVRAAFQLQDSELNPEAEIALFGIAGGGVGSAFAAESAQSYAPELDMYRLCWRAWWSSRANFMGTPTARSAPASDLRRCSAWNRGIPRWS